MTKEVFLEYLEYNVVSLSQSHSFCCIVECSSQLPKCTAYPGPLSVLVMDNAKIHHGDEILELVDRFGEFYDNEHPIFDELHAYM